MERPCLTAVRTEKILVAETISICKLIGNGDFTLALALVYPVVDQQGSWEPQTKPDAIVDWWSQHTDQAIEALGERSSNQKKNSFPDEAQNKTVDELVTCADQNRGQQVIQ